MCTGCGEMKPKRELCRVVCTKEGDISLDFTGKKNGRGAYVCKDVACIQKAKKNRRMERSFDQKIPDEVYEKMEEELS